MSEGGKALHAPAESGGSWECLAVADCSEWTGSPEWWELGAEVLNLKLVLMRIDL